MLGEMKKLKSLVILMSCVLLTGAIFPDNLFADTVIEEWVARYSAIHSFDQAEAIALDTSGNIYVTGTSYTGVGNYDYATVKYDSYGNQLWVAWYNGPGDAGYGDDYASAIAVDGSGNVYVTGYSYGSGIGNDYATVKYAPDGTELWVARYNGPGNSGDVARAIAVDTSGNVYVVGGSRGIGTDWTAADYATIKYAPNGDELWVARYNGPENGYDLATSMAVDSSGNVYVTGRSFGSDQYDNCATVKYDTNGNQLWVTRSDSVGSNADAASAIALDSGGNVYVAGGSSATSGPSRDYTTVKYDTNGNELWAARYNGPANSEDYAYAIAVDGSGNVYLTGMSIGSGTYWDYATIKYDTNGNEVWVARYDAIGSRDRAYAIAVDGSGNVYVTGQSYGSDGICYATIKYDANGNEVWVAGYNNRPDDNACARAIALDSSGNVYVTGYSWGYGFDYTTIKYSQPGVLLLNLVQDVIELNLQQGISNSLDAKLDTVMQALDDINQNNDVVAINTLEAFINAVEAQSGNQISVADADALIAAAQAIIDILSGY